MSNKGKRPTSNSVPAQNVAGKEQMNVEEAISKSEAFILKYKNLIVAGVVAIIVIVAGTMLYGKYVTEPNNREAAEALYPAQNYFGAEEFELALNGDSLGNMGFVQIIDEYGGTPSGNLAQAYAGISLVNLKRYDEAVKYLKGFDGSDAMIAPAVQGALGTCYAEAGELDKAVSQYKSAAAKADNNSISPYYLQQAGLLCEKLGKKGDALKLYEQVKSQYPGSIQAMDIDKYIERVK